MYLNATIQVSDYENVPQRQNEPRDADVTPSVTSRVMVSSLYVQYGSATKRWIPLISLDSGSYYESYASTAVRYQVYSTHTTMYSAVAGH